MDADRHERRREFTAGAAILTAVLYAARSAEALTAGELDHMAHPASSGQPLVVAAFGAAVVALLGLRASALPLPSPRLPSTALVVAALGGLWAGAARLVELLGAAGPWGFYSAPGLVAFAGGLAVAGLTLRRASPPPPTHGRGEHRFLSPLGSVLVAIALLRAAAGIVSMTVFNLLGRDVAANVAATQAGQSVRLLEALCWIVLAVIVSRSGALRSAPEAPRSARPLVTNRIDARADQPICP